MKENIRFALEEIKYDKFAISDWVVIVTRVVKNYHQEKVEHFLRSQVL